MKVKYFCSHWGLEHLNIKTMLEKIKTNGFDGVEIGTPDNKYKEKSLKNLLRDLKLEVIAHQYQAKGNTFKEYSQSFERSLVRAAEFQPLLINSHTGRDYWSFSQNGKLIEIAQKISENYKIDIVHETHRGRFLYAAPVSRKYFEQYPDLKINFDLSHWCCVSESLLEDQKETVDLAIKKAGHIHARVGHAQGPQISDPEDSCWEKEMHAFLNWWVKILNKNLARKKKYMTITPEFGPIPYTMRKPYSKEPQNDFFKINLYMKSLLKKHFSKFL